MTYKEQIIQLFQNTGSGNKPLSPIFLPDFTTWYKWHSKKGTLPKEFTGKKMEDICRSLNVPIWNTCQPWSVESKDVEISHTEEKEEMITRYQFKDTTLTAKWKKGPDGDWWQTEYPVKKAEDLDVLRVYLEGRTFKVEMDELSDMLDETGNDGIVAPMLPSRAFSWMMLEMIGWREILIMLLAQEETIRELVNLAEKQIQAFTRILLEKLQSKGCKIYLSPDNLDGMFVTPKYFDEYLTKGYEETTKICHEHNSFLIVHGGGPLETILENISNCRIDCIAGISGPPQGNTPIETARLKAGEKIVMWGGIPQDYLLDLAVYENYREKFVDIINFCKKDGRSIIGIADHVPLDTDISRLKQIVDLINA